MDIHTSVAYITPSLQLFYNIQLSSMSQHINLWNEARFTLLL